MRLPHPSSPTSHVPHRSLPRPTSPCRRSHGGTIRWLLHERHDLHATAERCPARDVADGARVRAYEGEDVVLARLLGGWHVAAGEDLLLPVRAHLRQRLAEHRLRERFPHLRARRELDGCRRVTRLPGALLHEEQLRDL